MPPCRSGNFYSKSWIIINDFGEQMCLSQRMCKVDLCVPQGRRMEPAALRCMALSLSLPSRCYYKKLCQEYYTVKLDNNKDVAIVPWLVKLATLQLTSVTIAIRSRNTTPMDILEISLP